MSRLFPRSACLCVGLMIVAGAAAPSGLGQQKNDPKKTDAKKAEPKKPPQKKKAEPRPTAKPPEPKSQPKPAAPEAPLPIPDGPPNPLDLVRGLREQGMSDLALEYIQELGKKPGVPEAVKLQLPLERAKCQLDAANDEPDEGTRISLVAEAKEGFQAFLKNPKNKNHPRAAEAYIALARLTSMEAKSQLAKARRIDVPAGGSPQDDAAREEAIKAQKAEVAKARPLFEAAAKQLKSAVKLLEAQLAKTKDGATHRALTQTFYDAEFARGTNQYALAETYDIHATTADLKTRDDKIEEARAIFAELADRDGAPARVTGVARAWMAECLFGQKKDGDGENEFKRIKNSGGPDAEDARRMVGFFELRRAFFNAVAENSPQKIQAAEVLAKDWLRLYGSVRRAQGEANAVRWYLAFALQLQGDRLMPAPPKGPPKGPPKTPQTVTVPASARALYEQAEKLYRQLSHSDNEYTDRATRQRMIVVRRLLGEADRPPAAYKTFEEAQMASLIQMARLMDLERDRAKNADEIKKREQAVIALLEHARDLAAPSDNPADVADVYLRLIYFYQVTDQPQLAAVLGEYVARTLKVPGGKAADAGFRGLVGYVTAPSALKSSDADKIDTARKIDRERAIRLARFLDEKYPNDTATDRARFQLGALLYEDGKPVEAYDTLLKVRPGFEKSAQARLFQGGIAYDLIRAKDSPLAADRRKAVFRRTTAELDKLVKPLSSADADDVRAYLSARCQLARLYLLEPRADPEGNKIDPGYAKARKVAEDALAQVPAFAALADSSTKTLSPDGWEMKLLAEDARTRAISLEGQTLFFQGKYDEAFKAIDTVLEEMKRDGTYSEVVKNALSGEKPAAKKEPEPKKGPAKKEPPKKGPEPKKDAAPKKDSGADMSAGDGPDEAVKGRIAKAADTVDRLRRDMIVLALKIRVKQGQAEKASEQLDLLKKYGGSIEANITTLEQITAEMAAQIMALRREGKPAEAKALSDGFAKLLNKLSAEPGLPTSVQRFLGQALILVGEYDKAVEALKKVPAPAKREDLAKPNEVADPAEKRKVLEYRRAALELVRAYRGAKKYPEAEAVLKDAMDTPEKNKGWASSSMDFRKEVALLYEARGADEPNVKEANKLWGEALREWTMLFRVLQKRLSEMPAEPAAGGGGNQRLAVENAFFEMFFNTQRCVVKANMQLVKTNPAKLQKTFDDTAKKFVGLEKASAVRISPEVREKYHDLLMEVPELKKAYEAAGGKFFLEKPAPDEGGM